ncbi:hypothetical protein [Streptomyces sp. NPDC059171]|uniref:hypothetical protein n=1 Tax=Streptomyces sp. NPDC059171 TaxID=3346755 RepID=UPI00369A32CD
MADDEADYVLTQLVELVNRSDAEFGMTVASNGLTVTGTLVSNRKWFDLQAQFLKAATSSADGEVGLHTIFEGWRDANREITEEEKRIEETIEGLDLPERIQKAIAEVTQRTGYIHLAKARYVSTQGFVPTEGVLWRGRLDAVTGWSVGEMRSGS